MWKGNLNNAVTAQKFHFVVGIKLCVTEMRYNWARAVGWAFFVCFVK